MRRITGATQKIATVFRTKALGLLQSFILALLLSVLAFLGGFTPVDGRLYDIFVTYGPSLDSAPRRVVLIDSTAQVISDPNVDWINLVNGLIALGAQQVVFTVLPAGSPQVLAALHSNPRVVLGTGLTPDPEQAGSQVFDLPPALRNHALNAVADTPEAMLGLHRYQRYSYLVGDRTLPSIEALAARRLGREVPDEGRFLINFGGKEQSFPRMHLQQVIEGRLISEVVQGRVVLIGIGKERFYRNVVTPITTFDRDVSELEYHGYALDSLLNEAAIRSLLPLTKAVLLLAVWLLYFFMAQPMSFRAAVTAGTFMGLGIVLLAWFFLVAFNIHVPVLGSLLVLGTTLVSIFHHKAKYHDRVLERLVNSANLAQDEWLTAQKTPADDGFSSYVFEIVDQTLPITRAVLFERTPGTSRLRAVHFLRCSAGMIGDDTPDIAQEPFASAVRAGNVAELRGLLIPIDGESRQFFAPLLSQSECVGGLAFGTSLADEHVPTVLRAASALSKRLAEMMLQNQRIAAEATATTATTVLRKYLSDKRNDNATLLRRHLQLAQRHSEFLEGVLHQLVTPTIVFDLFGRPLFVNNRMKGVMKEIGLLGDQSFAAADFIEHACGLSPQQSLMAFTSVAIDGNAFHHPVWIGAHQQRLEASTLGGTSLSETTYEDMLAEAHGLVFQLLPQDGRPQRVQTVAAVPGAEQLDQTTDLWQCLESAAAKVTGNGEFEGLHVILEGERTAAMVGMMPSLLEELLLAVLQLLAYDARLPGDIVARLTRRDRLVELDIRNAGFGMPDDRLQAMLDGPIWPQSSTLRRVRQLRGSSLGENGALLISSAIGTGYRATLTLQLTA